MCLVFILVNNNYSHQSGDNLRKNIFKVLKLFSICSIVLIRITSKLKANIRFKSIHFFLKIIHLFRAYL